MNTTDITEILIELFNHTNNIRHAVSDKRDLLCTSIDRAEEYCVVNCDLNPQYELLKTIHDKTCNLMDILNHVYSAMINTCDRIWEKNCIKFTKISFNDITDTFNAMTALIDSVINDSSIDEHTKYYFNKMIKSRFNSVRIFYKRYLKNFAN